MTTKYVIELGDDVQFVAKVGVTASGNAYSLGEYKADLEELNSGYINEHFSDLQDTAYQRGLEEGREQMPCDTCAYRHNKLLCTDCKWNYGSRYKEDNIGAGDVVIYNQKKCVVVTPETNEKYASLFDCNGNHYSVSSQNCQKTGEHYNINEILGGLCHD